MTPVPATGAGAEPEGIRLPGKPVAADPDAGARLLGPRGRPFSRLDLLVAWLRSDSVRASWRRPGRPDWGFEAILPGSPLSAGGVFRSAAERNLRLSRNALDGPHRIPPPPPARFASAPRRLLRLVLRGAPVWQMAELLTDPLRSGPVEVRPVLPLPGTLRADPFALRADGVDWLLFEEEAPGDRGRLRAARRVDGIWRIEEGEILPRPHHLSWPCGQELDGRIHLLPESGEAMEVSLLAAESFPTGWRKVRTLLSGRRWLDPCLLRRNGRWWLFACAGGDHPGDHSSELHAFHTDDPVSGELVPHPLNPLSLSVAGARPAGAFFERGGRLFRPSQDCRGGYGSGLVVQEVLALSPTEWSERPVSRLSPPPGSVGIHTLNPIPGGGWIVDVCG